MLPSGGASPFVGDRRTSVTRHPFASYSAAKLASPRGDVHALLDQVPFGARLQRAVRAEERVLASALARAAHAVDLARLHVALANLLRVARAAAGAVVRARDVRAVQVAVPREAPAHRRELRRVAGAVAHGAVVGAPERVRRELPLQAEQDVGEAALVVAARQRRVRRQLRGERRHRLAPVVGDVVRRQHADGRRPELALRGPRPRVWHVHGDGDVHLGQRAFGVVVDADAADAGDDGQARAGGLPDGFVPRGQGLELLPALGVGSRAARHALHQTQQVLRLERRADQVHVRDVRRLHHRVHETQPAVVQKQVQEVRRVVAPRSRTKPRAGAATSRPSRSKASRRRTPKAPRSTPTPRPRSTSRTWGSPPPSPGR